jgi:outer membrane biosynthesis protein TonB
MNRIITILVTIFILLLLYIWISHVWGSDNPRHPNEIVDARQNEAGDGLMADADSTLHTDVTETPKQETNTSSDEFNTDRKAESDSSTDDTPSTQEAVVQEKKNEDQKPAVTKPVEQPKKVAVNNTPAKSTAKTTNTKPATTSAKKPVASATKSNATSTKAVATPVSSGSSTAGQHLVIAGNFSQLVNAQQRVDELKRAGFKDAEIINFDLSEYHTVCVGRYSDVNEARKMVKKLKDYHKIDAYVRIGG